MTKHYKIIKNAARCLKCHMVIESKSRHDFQYCKCQNIFVDGGLDYLRSGAQDINLFQDLSETVEVDADFSPLSPTGRGRGT